MSMTSPTVRIVWSERLETLVAALVLFPAVIATLACAGFAWNEPIRASYGLLAAAMCAAFVGWRHRAEPGVAAGIFLSVGGVVIVGGLLGLALADVSYDGLYYHQGAVMELARGWNPWRAPASGAFHVETLWVDFYPKSAWENSAMAELLTERIDTGKWLQVVLATSALLSAFVALLRVEAISVRRALLAAALLAANPVLLCQWHTFYVDGMMASLALVAASGLWLVVGHRRAAGAWVAIPALLLMMSTKQTGVLMAVVLCAFAVGWQVKRAGWKSGRRLGFALLAAGVFGVGFLGFSPYVQNVAAGRHVFHPLLGAQKYDMLGPRRPPNLPASRIGAFFAAQFAESRRPEHVAQPVRWKIPFAFSGDELWPWELPDVKAGAFGPWYGALLCGAFAGMLALFKRRDRSRLVLVVSLTLAVALMVFDHDLCWWARYVPLAWWWAWIVLLVTLDLNGRGWSWWRNAMLALGVVNCSLIAVTSVIGRARSAHEFRLRLEAAKSAQPIYFHAGHFPVLAERLREAKIEFTVLRDDAPPDARHLFLDSEPDAYWTRRR